MSQTPDREANDESLSETVPGKQSRNRPEPAASSSDPGGCEPSPTISTVMEAVFDLGPAKRATFHALQANPGSTTTELAEVLERDRSNVNRSLTALMEAGLVNRRRRLLPAGGYIFQYSPRPAGELEVVLQSMLRKWADAASTRIAELAANTPDETEGLSWVDRLIISTAGDVTATEEFVFHHGLESERRDGASIPKAVDRGAWSPQLRTTYVNSGSRATVRSALDRLESNGFIEQVEPVIQDNWSGPYWRLTPAGERLQQVFNTT